jgi:integrase
MTQIQRILGHKNLSTTERYLGRCNEDLRGAMEALGNDGGFPEYHDRVDGRQKL